MGIITSQNYNMLSFVECYHYSECRIFYSYMLLIDIVVRSFCEIKKILGTKILWRN
jgi:hypothetical protein